MPTPVSAISPGRESTLQDYTITIACALGIFPLCVRGNSDIAWVEEFEWDPKETSEVVQGSDGFPRAHSGIQGKPTLSITLANDKAIWLIKTVRAGNDQCNVFFDRRPPRSLISVVDRISGWMPLDGPRNVKGGTPSNIKITGNVLRATPDYKGAIEYP
jgi:hypothetical protein